jgi:hypothetical protein
MRRDADALKARIAEIGETLTAQRLRLERLYLGDANAARGPASRLKSTSRWCAISRRA